MNAIAGCTSDHERLDPLACCIDQLRGLRALGDDPCIWAENHLAVGRRLSPTDPAHDRGPEIRADGAFALVADARIDNRGELSASLGLSGPQVRAHSDSALLLDCLLVWGLRALDRIVGDFAFAFWDRQRGTLILARDYSGQRPLYYVNSPNFFAFASMPCGLHALSDIPRRPCLTSAQRFMLQLHQPPDQSFFEGVMQVAPGHVLVRRAGSVRHSRWWKFERPEQTYGTTEDYVGRARCLLDRAVSDRMTDGGHTIGSHLSAGLDSSGVTATAARILGTQGRRLLAFTAVPACPNLEVPGGSIANEGALAAQVANKFENIEHITCSGEVSILGAFVRNVELWERIVPNPINDLWWSAIAKAASGRGISVLLSAPMGNVGFSYAGNEVMSELILQRRWRALAHSIAEHQKAGEQFWRPIQMTLAPFLPKPAWMLIRAARGQIGIPDLLSENARISGNRLSMEGRADPESPLRRRLNLIATIDPGAFNTGIMAGSQVEIRDAASDRRLMEFALGLPLNMFSEAGDNRILARRSLADRVPAAILRERRRGYQSADWYVTLRNNRDELIDEADAIAASSASEIVNAQAIRRLLIDLPNGRWASHRSQVLYRGVLIRALAAGHFLRSAKNECPENDDDKPRVLHPESQSRRSQSSRPHSLTRM